MLTKIWGWKSLNINKAPFFGRIPSVHISPYVFFSPSRLRPKKNNGWARSSWFSLTKSNGFQLASSPCSSSRWVLGCCALFPCQEKWSGPATTYPVHTSLFPSPPSFVVLEQTKHWKKRVGRGGVLAWTTVRRMTTRTCFMDKTFQIRGFTG